MSTSTSNTTEMPRPVPTNRAGGWRRRLVPLTATVLTVAIAAACGASGTSSPPESTCVTDVDDVIAKKATPESTTAALPVKVVAKLDAAAQVAFEQASTPGAIVGVRSPQGTWIKAYGEADPATGAPMKAGMYTRIGSVTKTFTGTMIMQLAEQGRLSLDDTIDEYVPGIPNGDRVTLRMLANMTSGVATYSTAPAFFDVYAARPDTTFTPDELVAIGVADSPIFEPGADFNYSNTNTFLLGMVIEKVSGQPIATVIQQRILDPLEMSNTSWPGDSTEIPSPYPQGFTLQGDAATSENPSNATHWNPSWQWAAGGLISNVDDLLAYARALGTGQGLLDVDAQAERLTSFPGVVGYGIGVGCVDGWVGHTGELPGYNTALFYDTTSDTSIIVQTNSDIASGDCPDSPTLPDDPREAVCSSPATRMFVALSTATGHTFTPNTQR